MLFGMENGTSRSCWEKHSGETPEGSGATATFRPLMSFHRGMRRRLAVDGGSHQTLGKRPRAL